MFSYSQLFPVLEKSGEKFKKRKSVDGLDGDGSGDEDYTNKDIVRFLKNLQKEQTARSDMLEKKLEKLDSVDKKVSKHLRHDRKASGAGQAAG